MPPPAAPIDVEDPDLIGDAFTGVIEFGAFAYSPDQALLLQGARPVRIGSRALDILDCLLANAGDVVEKSTIARWVWPTTVVEEVGIRVHLAALRKALGDGRDGARYIINVPGRGYRFVAPVRRRAAVRLADSPLDDRARELIALVAATCFQRQEAIDLHAAAARRMGVRREHITEALALAATFSGLTDRAVQHG